MRKSERARFAILRYICTYIFLAVGRVVQGNQEDGIGAVPLGGPRLVLAPGATDPTAEVPRLRREPHAPDRQGGREEGGVGDALPRRRVARDLPSPRSVRHRRGDPRAPQGALRQSVRPERRRAPEGGGRVRRQRRRS